MSSHREHDGLLARIRQLRRAHEAAERPARGPVGDPEQDRLASLEARITHLEQLVQGLQDSVHRESSRQAKRISELEARVQPAALGRAMTEDARARGL
jgi:uncharacterized coiled-coil protein SlyX